MPDMETLYREMDAASEAAERQILATNPVVEFYDIHTGISGAGAPIPDPVRWAVETFLGRPTTLARFLREVRGEARFIPRLVTVRAYEDFIELVQRQPDGGRHHWRLVRYRPVDVAEVLWKMAFATAKMDVSVLLAAADEIDRLRAVVATMVLPGEGAESKAP